VRARTFVLGKEGGAEKSAALRRRQSPARNPQPLLRQCLGKDYAPARALLLLLLASVHGCLAGGGIVHYAFVLGMVYYAQYAAYLSVSVACVLFCGLRTTARERNE